MWQMLSGTLMVPVEGQEQKNLTLALLIQLNHGRPSREVTSLWKLRIRSWKEVTRQIGFTILKTVSTGLGTCKSFTIICGEIPVFFNTT